MCYRKALMRRKPNGGRWSRPELADWLHGYTPGRRRDSAVLIRQVTTWRLERGGLKSFTAFHDLTNAFGTVKWEAMDRAVASLDSRDTDRRLPRSQEEMATSHSRLVRAASWGTR